MSKDVTLPTQISPQQFLEQQIHLLPNDSASDTPSHSTHSLNWVEDICSFQKKKNIKKGRTKTWQQKNYPKIYSREPDSLEIILSITAFRRKSPILGKRSIADDKGGVTWRMGNSPTRSHYGKRHGQPDVGQIHLTWLISICQGWPEIAKLEVLMKTIKSD